jgi:hypothetical protein
VTTVDSTVGNRPLYGWALAAAEMRRLHLDTPGRLRYTDLAASTLLANHELLRTAAHNEAANTAVVGLRVHATPLTYRNRLYSVAYPRDAAWRAEERLIVDTSKTMRAAELSALRRRAEKDLARASARSRHTANWSLHDELAGEKPIDELVSRLATQQIIDMGSPRFASLAKRQRRTRKALVERDLRVLESLIVLLLNADHAVPSVFVVSYSLAVGSVALV